MKTYKYVDAAVAVADAATSYLALTILAIILLISLHQSSSGLDVVNPELTLRGKQLSTSARPCDEIYVVGEGETLHTISDKCGDSFIVEQNPHIQDPDDVFPGLVIKITPSGPRKR